MSTTKSSNPWLWLSYATIVGVWALSQIVFIPYVVHLLLLVMAILYAACHHSLVLLLPPDQEETNADGTTSASSNNNNGTLKQEDAMHFPIMGSISLFGLYLAFRFLNKDWVNWCLSGYFGIVGCFALTATLSPLLLLWMIPKSWWKQKVVWHWAPQPKWIQSILEFILETPDIHVEFQRIEVIGALVAAVICGFYLQTKHWALNNVLGICFCLQGIERFSLGTYKIGAILLLGLFVYDIFWVFGTNVMVTVAKNVDGPIKILFPRSLVPNADTGKLELSLLGLGDIVIPGFLLALLLRFDAEQAKVIPTLRKQDKDDLEERLWSHSFAKPYFHSAFLGYFLGLAMTLWVMIVFSAAQPALLYLVPACLGSSMLCAVLRGEVKALLAYSEEDDEESEEGKAKNKDSEKSDTAETKSEATAKTASDKKDD